MKLGQTMELPDIQLLRPPRRLDPGGRQQGQRVAGEAAQAGAQHLAALAEGGPGQVGERGAQPGRGLLGPRRQADHAGADLGRRREGGGREVEDALHPAQELRHDRQPAIVRRAGRGGRAAAPPPSGTSAPSARCRPAGRTSRTAAASRHCRAGWRRSAPAGRRRWRRGRSPARRPRRTVSRPPLCASSSRRCCAKRGSRSTATRRPAPASRRARVSPPGPGPISSTTAAREIARGGGDAAQDRRVEQEMLAQPLVGVQALGAQPAAEAAGGVRSGRRRTPPGAGRAGSGWPGARAAAARWPGEPPRDPPRRLRPARAGRGPGRCGRRPALTIGSETCPTGSAAIWSRRSGMMALTGTQPRSPPFSALPAAET